MLILILGLIFGIVLLILVGRSVKKNSRERLRYGDRLIDVYKRQSLRCKYLVKQFPTCCFILKNGNS